MNQSQEKTRKMLKQIKLPFFLPTTRKGTLFHLTPFNYDKLDIKGIIISSGDFYNM